MKKRHLRKSKALFGVLFSGSMGTAIGIFIGMSLLIAQPLKIWKVPPKKDEVHGEFIMWGSELGGNVWKQQVAAFTSKQVAAFTSNKPRKIDIQESSLNFWARDLFRQIRPVSNSKRAVQLIPTRANFRIFDNKLQLIVTFNVALASGKRFTVTYVTLGPIKAKGDSFKFVPEKAYIGSAIIPSIGGGANALFKFIIAIFKVFPYYPQLEQAWNSLTNVKIDGNTLILEHLKD